MMQCVYPDARPHYFYPGTRTNILEYQGSSSQTCLSGLRSRQRTVDAFLVWWHTNATGRRSCSCLVCVG